MTRLLLVGDSHTKDMQPIFISCVPKNHAITTFPIQLGQVVNDIASKYRDNLQEIYHYDPTVAIIHVGHNSMVFHHYYNQNPQHPRIVGNDTLNLASEVLRNFPQCRTFISTVFPRTSTDNSLLSPQDVSSYNQKVKRHAQYLCSITRYTSLTVLKNMCLWTQVSRAIENPDHFDIDGLHLTKAGKKAIIQEWLPLIL
jgi:lysophospholipase L1-like esterase